MAELQIPMSLPHNMDVRLKVKWALYLPNHVRLYDTLEPCEYGPPYTQPHEFRSYPYLPNNQELIVPMDLITAARLNYIRPGDDSGIGEEQWAWMKLIGLVGEKTT